MNAVNAPAGAGPRTRTKAVRWEGPRPRDPSFSKPSVFHDRGRNHAVTLQIVFAAREDARPPSAARGVTIGSGRAGSLRQQLRYG